MDTPEVSVLILTHNRLGALRGSLDALMRHTRRSLDACEVIVVDNGSTDGTGDYLRSLAELTPWLRPVLRKENEFVCARNYGIEIARAPFIAQVDDDVLVHPGWDDILLAPMLADSHIGATGQHGFYQDATWQLLIDDRRRPVPGQYADLLMGYCWAWRQLATFSPTPPDAVSGSFGIGWPLRYDWEFNPFWHEESDLQLQIRAAGYRCVMVTAAATHNSLHNWQDTLHDRGHAAESVAKANFEKLREKWQDYPGVLIYEGPLVGLTA